jgi:hypothetical protein
MYLYLYCGGILDAAEVLRPQFFVAALKLMLGSTRQLAPNCRFRGLNAQGTKRAVGKDKKKFAVYGAAFAA